jgi:hypothetical protein
MATLSEILLKIRSTFDPKGAQDATKATQDLGKSTKDSADATQLSAKELNALNAVTNVSSGNIMGMVRSVITLSKSLEGLQVALPYITIIATAVIAFQKAIGAAVTAQADYQKMLNDIKTENATNSVNNLTDAYGRMKDAMDEAFNKGNDLMELEASMVETMKNNAIARENLRLAEAVAGTTDPNERARLEAESAQNKARIDSQFQEEADALRERQIQARIDKAAEDQITARQMQDTFQGEFARQNENQQRAINRTMGRDSSFFGPNFKMLDLIGWDGAYRQDVRQNRAYENNQKEINSYGENIKKAADGFKTSVNDFKTATRSLGIAEEEMRQFQIQRETNIMNTQTTSVTADTRSADVVRSQEQQAERERLQADNERIDEEMRRVREEESRRKTVSSEEIKNAERLEGDAKRRYEQARKTPSKKDDAPAEEGYKKAYEAAQSLRSADASYHRMVANTLSDLAEQKKLNEKEIRDIGKRSSL